MTTALLDVLAENIRRLRKEQGFSQDELSDRSGLHRTYIGGIERSERNISLAALARLANALDVAPAALLTNRDDG